MFNITQNGELIATVDKLAFVKRQDNGVIVNCSEAEAHGIVYGEAFYHLPYLPLFPGAEDATVEEFSGVDTIAELDEALLDAEYENLLGGLEL